MESNSKTIKTIAELEIYGLPPQVIELLDRHGYIYVVDLERLTAKEFLTWKQAGAKRLAKIQTALANYLVDRPVKSVEDCICIQIAAQEPQEAHWRDPTPINESQGP